MATGRNYTSREDPARTGPNRSRYSRVSQPTGGGAPSGVIDQAVKLAYHVVDDHIRQGRDAAERLRSGTYSSKDFDDDMHYCLDRALSLSKEWGLVGSQFFDVVSRMAGSRMGGRSSSAPDVGLEIKSKKRTEVKFHLRPSLGGAFNPSVPPIHSADRDKKAIDGVHFAFRDGGRPVLVVDIPDEQPAGFYHGAIVDSKTNEPQGFISVRVAE